MRLASYLGAIFLASEVALTISHRSRGTGVRQDRSTLRLLWAIIALAVIASIYTARHAAWALLPRGSMLAAVALVIFTAGIALRWWAIIVLGRFFTVDVHIEPDHQLVDHGPFRLLRHPSYSGVLLAFAGFGLALANWLAAVVLLLPILLAFARRINVEERALLDGLGKSYRDYTAHTKRLIPYVY